MIISFPFLRSKDLHTYLLIMRACSFLTLLYVGVTYARLVFSWHKTIFRIIAVFILFHAANGEKMESDENNIKTRQQLDRDKTLLLLATWNQGKWTLRYSCQFTRPVVDPMPPLLLSSIPWRLYLSSADASVVVVVVSVLLLLLRRLYHCSRFFGCVIYPPPPLSLSPIPQTRHVFLVLCRPLCCHLWFLWPVLLYQCRPCCRRYPELVITLAPPRLETFTWTRCIFCFLNWLIRCHCRYLRIICLCQCLCRGRQFLMPFIAT